MTGKRPTLLLVGDTVDDRRVIAAVLNEHRGSIVPVVIPTSAGRAPVRLRIGQQLIVIVTSTDRQHVVPIRFATAADVEPGQTVTTILLELEGHPTIGSLDLVQAFVEARSIRPERGRLHLDGPPLASAADDEDAWVGAVTRLTEFDPDAYRDTAFLQLDDTGTAVRIIAPAMDASHMASLRVTFIDAEGAVVADAPGSTSVDLPDGRVTRVEVRHRSVHGTLPVPNRLTVADESSGLPLPEPPPSDSAPSTDAPRIRDAVAAPTPTPFDAYGLLQLLDRDSSVPASLLAEAAARLEQATPNDVRIVIRRGRAHIEDGRYDRAVEALTAIPTERRPGDAEALLLVAELASGAYDVPLDRYGRAVFDDWTFERLVDAVANLSAMAAASVTEALMMVLSEPRAAALVARVGERLPAGPSLIAIAGRIAAVSPGEAVLLLQRAGAIEGLATDLIDRLYHLQVDIDETDIAPVAIELVRRQCSLGSIGAAAVVADQVRHRLHWRDAQALADVLLDHLVKGTPEWTDERILYAHSAIALMQDAIRGLKDVDLAEAIEVSARLRQALEPAPAEVTTTLSSIDEELFTALDATEAHRAALEELNQASMQSLRDSFNGKRLLVVGGRRPDWWDDLLVEVALDRNSTWREVEPGRRPSMEWLKDKVGGGRIDLLVVITDYIAHATSAIGEFAEGRHLPVARARAGRYSFLTALRGAAKPS